MITSIIISVIGVLIAVLAWWYSHKKHKETEKTLKDITKISNEISVHVQYLIGNYKKH